MTLKLIATCPRLHDTSAVRKVFSCPEVSEVRFNTGAGSHLSIPETVKYLKQLSIEYKKKIWIDIKGRQLRITRWADPLFDCITLNHRISVKLPAKIHLRNAGWFDITHVSNNGADVFVTPIPRRTVGAGQSVNIIAEELSIYGYLTSTDETYLSICQVEGVNDIMASFVEDFSDLQQILNIVPKANIVSKIESKKGIDFIKKHKIGQLMAARDDLFTELNEQPSLMYEALDTIITNDPSAMCASKIFTSLEYYPTVQWSDHVDLASIIDAGYTTFMLCDNICNYSFDTAIETWRKYRVD